MTRGVGNRAVTGRAGQRCTRVLLLSPLPRSARAGAAAIRVRICATRLGANPRLAGMKTLNRLDQVIARCEWRDGRIAEGLMLGDGGDLVCGTMSNLFLRRGKVLLTPALDRCGVARRDAPLGSGTRGRNAAATGRAAHRPRDLELAEEIFMTNALAGPMAVAEIRDGPRRIRPPRRDLAVELRKRLELL